MSDEELLEFYMKGFSDELSGGTSDAPDNELALKAYNIGSWDAYIGDAVRSIDYQTNEEILKRIKHKKNELD